MTTYNELVAYFQSMPSLVPGIRSVTVGADEEVMNQQLTRIQYPHLWVETPGARFLGTDVDPRLRLEIGLNLIQAEGTQTNSAANLALSATLNLLELVYAQMLADSDNDLFDLILTSNAADPIRRWSADNAYGWRLEVSIEIQRLECGPPISVWTPDPVTGDTYQYIVPAGHLLVAVYLKSDEAQIALVGTTAGGDQVGGPAAGSAGEPIIFSGLNLFAETDTTLYFSGLAGTNVVKIWTIKN